MIHVQNKYSCVGCSACVQVCPKQCICFKEDEQGFCYPQVNLAECVNCRLCEKVCPVLNESGTRKPLHVYVAMNPNVDIREKSSSGGIFTILAESVISNGGVVFGARFNESWNVIHDYTESLDGLDAFRRSKYVQSIIGETYKQVKFFLQQGREVLFTGTPCQIAGLRNFLQKEYNNLLTIDVVCHGVPSPLVWRTYLSQFLLCSQNNIGKSTILSQKTMSVINDINFRDKRNGWKIFGLAVHGLSVLDEDRNSNLLLNNQERKVSFYESLHQNLFMQIFLKNLCLRPSCYHCPTKSGKSQSDITLGDYWGICNHHPNWDDDKGTSLVLINTLKGEKAIENLNIYKELTSYNEALCGNPSIERSVDENKYVPIFWYSFLGFKFKQIPNLVKKMKPSLLKRILCKIRRVVLN